ncbi:MAG: phosphoadenylyl-sulfate reductase [Magnetovibrio sp.]|nr:phosphoadenylyl-sulfate reductase [Magnetovibrio sp.]
MKTELINTMIKTWRKLDGGALLKAVILNEADARVAVSSSFGAESAVLLGLVAEIDPSTPVLTVDTGKLFDETIEYRNRLVDHFGLLDVRIVSAPLGLIDSTDADGDLHQSNPDLCCQVRKVMPHAQAAADFDILITGRKQFHGEGRQALPTVNIEGQHIKVNPLATWSEADIEDAFQTHQIPRHPLVVEGYRSIGCATCTLKTGTGQNARAGRWAGQTKTECGLHSATFDTFQFKFAENRQ